MLLKCSTPLSCPYLLSPHVYSLSCRHEECSILKCTRWDVAQSTPSRRGWCDLKVRSLCVIESAASQLVLSQTTPGVWRLEDWRASQLLYKDLELQNQAGAPGLCRWFCTCSESSGLVALLWTGSPVLLEPGATPRRPGAISGRLDRCWDSQDWCDYWRSRDLTRWNNRIWQAGASLAILTTLVSK